MTDNLKIEVFQSNLSNLINNSELPIGVLVLVLDKALTQLEQIHQKILQQEIQQLKEKEKEQPEVIKDDSKTITSVKDLD